MNFSIADYCERKESETAFLLFVYKYLWLQIILSIIMVLSGAFFSLGKFPFD
jgi:hypothetical protein